ncbi:hypothetical protein Q1695_013730 [Nippostrongylus brasiliensis]|nr:hypothetical protein Q1695_013730 [Nippostrongylus brasiliensis]
MAEDEEKENKEEKKEEKEEKKEEKDKKKEEKDDKIKEDRTQQGRGEEMKGLLSKLSEDDGTPLGKVLGLPSDQYTMVGAGLQILLTVLASFYTHTLLIVLDALVGVAMIILLVFAYIQKNAQFVAFVMIGCLVCAVLAILGLLFTFVGEVKIAHVLLGFIITILRLIVLGHLFFVANKVRKVYKDQSESKAPSTTPKAGTPKEP